MPLTAYLSDFSLTELFQFMEKTQKTGLLSFDTTPRHYIGIIHGNIVGATNRPDQEGLVSLIKHYQWVTERVLSKLTHGYCPIDEPLGLWLTHQGVLETKQLKQLFNFQLSESLSFLLQLEEAQFKFDQHVLMPGREMTGLCVPATEVILIGPRSSTLRYVLETTVTRISHHGSTKNNKASCSLNPKKAVHQTV